MIETNIIIKPKAYRVPDACKALGIGKSTLYRLVKTGHVRLVKINGRTLMPADELDRLATHGTA